MAKTYFYESIGVAIALFLMLYFGFDKYPKKESYTLADYCKFKYCACRPTNPNSEDICT